MKVLVVGTGAREHAICDALIKDDVELYASHNNLAKSQADYLENLYKYLAYFDNPYKDHPLPISYNDKNKYFHQKTTSFLKNQYCY